MNSYGPLKSTLMLVFFSTNLLLLPHANAEIASLKIQIDPETSELIQEASRGTEKHAKNESPATRPLLSIQASPIPGGGIIVTPNNNTFPLMSIQISDDGYMQTICQ